MVPLKSQRAVVFCSRYNVKFENVIPIIVIDKFPNKRSDFYEVLLRRSLVLKRGVQAIEDLIFEAVKHNPDKKLVFEAYKP